MKRIEQRKSALAVVALLCASVAQSCVEGPRPAASLPPGAPPVAAFFQAMRAGQLAVIDGYLAEDYFLIGVGGNTRDKAGRLAWLRSNVAQLSTVEPSDIKVRTYGDLAVVTGLVVSSRTRRPRSMSGSRTCGPTVLAGGRWSQDK